MKDIGRKTQDVRHKIQDIRYKTQEKRHKTQDLGYEIGSWVKRSNAFNFIKIVLIVQCSVFNFQLSFSQNYNPVLPPENIRTVQLFNPQTNDLNPVIEMGTQYLILSFDDLDAGVKNYSYQLEYKNPDWSDASIFSSEYLNGYTTGYIRDYLTSFNTYQNYTNYKLQIPNQDMAPRLSGNYELKVFEPGKRTPMFTKRFAVFEPVVDVFMNVERFLGKGRKNQQVITDVVSQAIDLTENPNGTELVILKNNNWEDKLTISNPQFAQPNRFTYNQTDILFEGGWEHYWFDTKNIQVPSLTTQTVERVDSVFHTYLYYDEVQREDSPYYIDNPDVNGAFYIRNAQLFNELEARNQADYTWVYFGLENFDNENGNLEAYVVGGFNDWELTEDNKLKPTPNGPFETELFLKQGYYNYTYAIKNKKKKTIDYFGTTGSYWQTENYYQGLFYYQPWGERYHRLIGAGEAYSRASLR